MHLELISFKLCPFVQRSVITLLYKKVVHQITYIDLSNKPEWFLKISPLGKVPVLRVEKKTVIFESAVINEFIDEITPNRLHPEDPVRRAHHRAWIEFGSACLVDQFHMFSAKEKDECEKARGELLAKLERVEKVITEGPYFDGQKFSLVDTAFAPALRILSLLGDRKFWKGIPKVKKWAEVLLALPSVQKSVVPEFNHLFREYLVKHKSYLSNCLVRSGAS